MEELILEVRADSPWCESAPSFGVVKVDKGFLQEVRYLRAEAERLKAYSITLFDFSVTFHEWDDDEEGNGIPGKEVRTDCHMLCVAKDKFWWEGSMKGSRETFRTEEVSIDGLSPYRCHNIGISLGEAEKRRKRRVEA